MSKYETLLDAACALYRSGYRWDPDYLRFRRDSWDAHLAILKNGKCRVVSR